MKYAVLGCGRMGGAMVRGMLAAGIATPGEITISSRTPESTGKAATSLGVKPAGDHAEALRDASVVFLGVKPAQAITLLREVSPNLKECLLISMVTGIHAADLAEAAGNGVRIIRTMPNTAVRLRKGMTAIAPAPSATADDLGIARSIFSSVGSCVEVSEKDLDTVTAVSGSGPAFALLMLEALAQGGVEGGLSQDAATRFAASALAAAASLVLETGEAPLALRAEITSPAGTTAAGLAALEEGEFPRAVRNAVRAARNRAIELSSQA